MTETQTRLFNGFPSQIALDKARALVAEARDFPRAEQALRGLDAHAHGSVPVSVQPWGVIFGSAPERFFDEGLAGALGRGLLKVAHSAPIRTERAVAAELPSEMREVLRQMPELTHPVPNPTAAPRPAPFYSAMAASPKITTPPAASWAPALLTPPPALPPALPPASISSTSPAFNPTLARPSDLSMPADRRGSGNSALFEETLEGDPGPVPDDYEDEGEEPFEAPTFIKPVARPAAPPRPAFLDAQHKPLSAQEVRNMMMPASALSNLGVWVSVAQEAVVRGPGELVGASTRLAWVACGGALRKAARDAGGAKLHVESDPSIDACGLSCFGVFPLEISGLAALGSEEAEAPEFMPALEAAFDQALESLRSRASLCGAAVVVLCGWGARHDWARARALAAGLRFLET